MAIARPLGPGVLTLHDVQAIRATMPDHSFSGAYVTKDAADWLAVYKPGSAYPAVAPTPNPVPGMIAYAPPAPEAAPPAPDTSDLPQFQALDHIGSGGSAGAASPYDPNTDPSFQQLMRQLALQETTLRSNAAQSQAQAQEQAAILGPRVAQQGIQARQGISNQFEEHGTFRSGLKLQDLAQERQTEQQKLADIQRSAATATAAAQQGLNTGLGDLANQRATAQLQATLRSGGVPSNVGT